MRIRVTTSWALAFMALAMAIFVTSCSDNGNSADETGGDDELTEVTLLAQMDDNSPATRVGMTKEGTDAVAFFWHKSDEICVQTKVGGGYSTGELWTDADTETGDVSTNFIGYIYGKLGSYAVYPYNEKHRFTSKTAMTYHLPAEYTYKTVESTIFSSTTDGTTSYPSNSVNIPMLAAISANRLYFKPIGGAVVIRIDKMPSASGTLTVTADQRLSGNFTIADLSATDPVLTTTTTTSSTADNTVTITFSGAAKGGVGVFYLPLSTGSYSNFKTTINYGSTMQMVNYGDLSVSRGDVTAISLTTNSKGKLWNFQSLGENKYRINGHVFVDLGLDSKVLWAACNIGAATEADDGGCYSWGETTTKGNYTWKTYKYYDASTSTFTKYNSTDGKTTLDVEDDAASMNWGTVCRMPTSEELYELQTSSNCTWAWTSKTTSSGTSINGHEVKSKTNGLAIFLPASGYRDGTGIGYYGGCGNFWSSTLDSGNKNNAYYLGFLYTNYGRNSSTRYSGDAVRPVAEK